MLRKIRNCFSSKKREEVIEILSSKIQLNIEKSKELYENLKYKVINSIGNEKLCKKISKVRFYKVNKLSFAVLLFMLLAAGAGSGLSVGYKVEADGQTVAILNTKKEAMNAFDSAKQSLAKNPDAKNPDVEVKLVVVNKAKLNKEEDAKDDIVAMFDGSCDAFGIYADQALVAAVHTEQEANELLDKYKDEYKGDGILEVGFNKNIEIKAVRLPESQIMDLENGLLAVKTPLGGIKTHEVVNGETLSEIAESYDMPLNKLMEVNPGITPETLQIGQHINVSDNSPAIAVRTKESITQNEVILRGVKNIEDSNTYKGTSVVVSAGEDGEKQVTYDVYKENGVLVNKVATAESIIKNPVDKQVKVGTKEKPKTASTGKFANPFYGGIVSSRYGRRSRGFHTGLDLAGKTGSPVLAADGGKVIFAGRSGGYGNIIKIRHDNGSETWYAHLSAINCSVGARVYKGQTIGKVGSTGNSTGPHLHFEIRINGKTVNPQSYI